MMKPDQDWMSVWPAQRTFHPASVPIPVRQGFAHLKGQVTPSKYANVELMKIPNFLHLTPPVIKRQCQLLKQFCTKWPEGTRGHSQMTSYLGPLHRIYILVLYTLSSQNAFLNDVIYELPLLKILSLIRKVWFSSLSAEYFTTLTTTSIE